MIQLCVALIKSHTRNQNEAEMFVHRWNRSDMLLWSITNCVDSFEALKYESSILEL